MVWGIPRAVGTAKRNCQHRWIGESSHGLMVLLTFHKANALGLFYASQ